MFFEAPHRIAATLADLAQLFGGQRRAVVARELTKLHEAVYRGTLAELCAAAAQEPNMARGEITVLVEGDAEPREQGADRALLARALKLLLPNCRRRAPPPSRRRSPGSSAARPTPWRSVCVASAAVEGES